MEQTRTVPAAVKDAIVEFKGVTKAFGKQTVLSDVSIPIERGKTTVIIGPSGTGKSVFIKLLVGLLKPDQGQILVDGKDVTRLKERELFEVRKKFGMLFQDGALFDSMNVADNVAFPLRQHTKKSEREIREIVAQKLAQVGLPGVEHKFPAELSGGMRKRVGIARAIATDPKIVLYDEPTAGLDPLTVGRVNDLIKKLQRELKVTSLLVTHDIRAGFRVANRVDLLREGEIVFDGTPEEMVAADDPYIKSFLS